MFLTKKYLLKMKCAKILPLWNSWRNLCMLRLQARTRLRRAKNRLVLIHSAQALNYLRYVRSSSIALESSWVKAFLRRGKNMPHVLTPGDWEIYGQLKERFETAKNRRRIDSMAGNLRLLRGFAWFKRVVSESEAYKGKLVLALLNGVHNRLQKTWRKILNP